MAQAIRNKDVRKNCVDVEKVIMECLCEPEREINTIKQEPVKIKKLSKELSKSILRNNANYHREFNHINRVNQNLVYKIYSVYNL